jgi:molybdopterin molybdotransferase
VCACECADAPHERREVAGRAQPVELGVGAERAREGGADGGALGGEIGGGDRGDGLERRALEQRQQPALRDRLRAAGEQLGVGPLHGQGPARAWGPRIGHPGCLYQRAPTPAPADGQNGRVPTRLLSIASARAEVVSSCGPLPAEPVALEDAAGRVLAADLRAAADVPRFDNSAMDGFAVRSDASSGALLVVDESRAGAPASRAVGPGEAIRISTGAAMPAGADAVAPVEQAREADGRVTLTSEVAPGRHVRRAGEDLRAGGVALHAGTRLGAGALSVAVGAGAGTLPCARRPRVAILCTGDELRPPGSPLGPGQIHNSNSPMLAALTRAEGAAVLAAEVVRDDREATEAALATALDAADVLVISGGVSVGPHDHVKPALEALGVAQRFWRIDLQPGKPTWFGTRGEQLVFGLPGNPVSSFVTFALFARPALRALQGAQPLPPREQALLDEDVPRRGRTQALRVRLGAADGTLRATPSGAQGSHVTASLVAADALAFVEPGEGVAAAGERIDVERL